MPGLLVVIVVVVVGIDKFAMRYFFRAREHLIQRFFIFCVINDFSAWLVVFLPLFLISAVLIELGFILRCGLFSSTKSLDPFRYLSASLHRCYIACFSSYSFLLFMFVCETLL